MRIDWRSAYNTAVGEIDAGRVQRVCHRARHAIIDRLIDLAPMPRDGTMTAESEDSKKLHANLHCTSTHYLAISLNKFESKSMSKPSIAKIEKMLDETLANLKASNDPQVRGKLLSEMRALITELDRLQKKGNGY